MLVSSTSLAEEKLSPSGLSALETLKALPESERNAILKQLGSSLPLAQSNDLETAIKKQPADAELDEKGGSDKQSHGSLYSLHFQATIISQKHDTLQHAPYAGQNSLLKEEDQRTSLTNTIFWGRKLWDDGEVYFNPEVSGGTGLSHVLGVAGFPNGDIEKVGSPQPTTYVARLFFRQTLNLGCETEKVEDDLNQVATERSVSRVTFQIGKMALTDVFDTNRYSHDPRVGFMNWSLMDFGAWDYPADARGYAPALTVEWNNKDWTLRYGLAMVVRRANVAQFDWDIGRAHGQALEYERRYNIFERNGAARAFVYLNNARMGSYKRALEEAPATDAIHGNSSATTALYMSREYRAKYGFGVNVEQEMLKDLGGFLRASWNDGHTESWMFTEIDQSISLGANLKGSRWGRPDDFLGFAGVVNGLSAEHANYLKAGGLGFILGDGTLNYTPEKILEAYYSLAMNKNIFLTLDYQHVDDPAYNRDRGPVNVGGVRLHIQY